MKEQKIAVVGFGMWGKNIVRNFYNLNVLDIVCDLDEEVHKTIQEQFPGVKVTKDFNDIINDSTITGVAIVTPSHTHFKLVKAMLEAGKNVYVEKTDGKIRINFDIVENATNYSVVISNIVEDVKTEKVDTNRYAFNEKTLKNGTYTVRVRANGDGEKYFNSLYSDPVTFSVTDGAIDKVTKLNAPTNVSASQNEQTVNVSFLGVANATAYKVILLNSKNEVVLTKDIENTLTTTSFDTSSLEEGDYNVCVVAVGNGAKYSDSDYSNSVSIKVQNGTPGINPGLPGTLMDYYKTAEGLTGAALKAELRKIITNTHKKVTSYKELQTYLQKADEDPNNPNNMLLYYTAESVTKTNNMDIWNREHVWAQSLTSGWFGTSGAGADMHHIRPCDPGVNSSRGNKKFGTASGYYNPVNINNSGQDYRGDTARIIMYLFVRYTQADSRRITDIFQSVEILLEWNKLDPVSETEIIRNEYTFKIQGNRNPFIDYPEFADSIWG